MKGLYNPSRTVSSGNRARSCFTSCLTKAALVMFCLFFLVSQVHAENGQGNIWYFGYGAGLDFNSGSPVVLSDGQINQLEGCATISDNDGSLLFYTDGMTVWNRNHAVMANGTGLMGDPSSTQSGVIVPKPGSNTIYYVFTVPATSGAADGLRYSEVDMTLDNGLGDINENKNVYVTGPVSEQVTAVVAANGQDIWVITHLSDSDAFHAFLVTSEGISDSPVVTNIGYDHGSAQIGYLKSSASGSRLASASYFQDLAEVYNFNTATGVVSDMISLDVAGRACYGVEFSPDEAMLYISAFDACILMQFDLGAGDAAVISASRVDFATSGNAGALQLAPDDKIYLSTCNAYLGVIDAPNVQSEGCVYHNDAIDLSPNSSGAGLPTFIQSFFIPQSVITADVTEITPTGAASGGTVEANEDDPNTARGVCWSTDPNPTLADSHTSDGSGAGSFVSTITGLTVNTTYNVRAYATNGAGTVYGANKSFTTLEEAAAPVVSTTEVTGITSTSAVSGGEVTSDGGAAVSERGVCWGTSASPTTSGSHTRAGTGTGSFSCSITGLSPETNYHVRAYAINEQGTSYGEDLSFATTATIVSLYDDEHGGPCFIAAAGEHTGQWRSAIISLALIMCGLLLWTLNRLSRPGVVRRAVLGLTMGIMLGSMAMPAPVHSADNAGDATGWEQIRFSIGAGYAYLGEDRSADYAGGTSDLEVDFALYPVLRASLPLAENCSLELGLRYNSYRWQVRDSISSDTSGDMAAVTALLGLAIYGQESVLPVLGAGRAFLQSGIGYSIVRTDFDFPVRKYDPAIGGEIAAGFDAEKWSCRIGYALFRHDADRTANGFSTDDSNDELDLSGVFLDISYRFDLGR